MNKAEDLYEAIGGGLCICQDLEVSHWCESCQRRIGLIMDAMGDNQRIVSWVREVLESGLLDPKREDKDIYEAEAQRLLDRLL